MDIWSRPPKSHLGVGLMEGKWPRVVLTADASMKMEALVQCCNIEISWLATSDRDDNDYVISDLVIPPQECSYGGTVFAEGDYMQMFMGPDGKLPREVLPMIDRLRAWGHSHHNMAVNPSNTDETQTKVFLDMAGDYADHFIRLICNKRGDMNVTLYLIDRGLVLYQPKLINLKPTREQREEYYANELYPFDDWAMDQISEKVRQAPVRQLQASDFTDEELAELKEMMQNAPDLQLGRNYGAEPDERFFRPDPQ